MSDRYKVMFVDEVYAAKLPGYEERSRWDMDTFYYALVRCDDNGKPVEVVGIDQCEPEDRSLVRDFAWVPTLANAQAAEISALRQQLIKANTENGRLVRDAGELSDQLAEARRENEELRKALEATWR